MLITLIICAGLYFAWKSGAHAFALIVGFIFLTIKAPALALGLPAWAVGQIATPLGQAVLTLFFVLFGLAMMFGVAGKLFQGK